MAKITLLLTGLFLTATLFAQKNNDVPGYGKVDKAELEMTECDFDKNAEAVVLFDVGEIYFNLNTVEMTFERHVRIKILKDNGLDRADIHLPYHSYRNDESIKSISAQTYNLDASGNIVVTKVDKKQIFKKELNKRYSEQVFTFPEVKAGSVIEYKYTHTNVGMLNWYFQRSIPVKFSRYTTDFPVELEIHCTPMCILPYDRKSDKKGSRDIQVFSMQNIPPLRDEPYISCDEDYLQRVELRLLAINTPERRVRLMGNWPGIVKQLMEDEDFGQQLKRNIPRTDDLDAELKTLTDSYHKMKAIYKYVQKNMEWNGYTGIWAFDGIRSAWKDKKGTIGEINLILVNLLRDAGLTARPILVSSQYNGRVYTAVADYRQFNKVMAYVEIDNHVYVLDATNKYNPPDLIPREVMFTEGLVIEKYETYEWGWKLLWDEKQQFKDVLIMQATIDDQGIMKGEASLNSLGYSRVQKLPDLELDKQKYIEKHFTASNSSLKLENLSFANQENDSLPLVQKINFTMPVNASGDYKYFSVNLFSGLDKNPFVSDSRFSDIYFGANQSLDIIANITIPDGYVFEALPKSIRMIMPDTSISITRRIAADKKQLSARITLQFKKPFFPVGDYPYFKEFYKKLFDLLNEQIAIRKETNP